MPVRKKGFDFFFHLQSPLLSPNQCEVFPVGWLTLFFVDPEERKHPCKWLRMRLKQCKGGGFAALFLSSGVPPLRTAGVQEICGELSEDAVTQTTKLT